MSVRGLRTKIAINIAILLFLGMFLINLVTMVTAKRDLIRSEVSRANIFLAALEYNLVRSASWTSNLHHDALVTKMISASQIACAQILWKNNEVSYFGYEPPVSAKELLGFSKSAMAEGSQKIHFTGTTWGVFWKQRANLIISSPLIHNAETVGGISILLPLENVYKTLRYSQQILFVYIFINVSILTFIGIYRISRLYILPLSRLAKRAEDYKEDDEIAFAVRKEDNELNRLSKALNGMLKRISADKEKLRATVLSLEKANLELKKAQQEIIRAEKLASVGRLSAGIAHEIGNPVGIVIGYLELLRHSDIGDEERNEYIERTGKEIERINTIIRQLLEVSRPSSAGRSQVSVHDIIHDTADVLRVQPLIANMELSLGLNAGEDTVYADPNQLRQVFLNLVINAADAISTAQTQNRGELKIITELANNTGSDLKSAGRQLKIIFMDNGPGIPEENIGNIFDPFFTTKDPGKGTGLGLSVSFMIVESMGGRMTVASEVGRGTTMTIYLPLCKRQGA